MFAASHSAIRRVTFAAALAAASVACAGPAETLHKAAVEGDAEKVQAVLAKHPDLVDHHDRPHGRTALHDAKTRAVAETLVAAGASLRSQDNAGRGPLHTATSGEVIDLLVEKGVDPKTPWGPSNNTALHSVRSAEAVEALIRHGVPPGMENAHHANALFTNESPDAIAALVRAGLDPNRDARGGQPIFHARAEAIKALAAAGADVNARNKDGLAPIHYHSHYSQVAEVEALLAAGADPNVRLPPDAVLYDGHHQMVIRKIGNMTPLQLAGNEQVKKALLKAGAVP